MSHDRMELDGDRQKDGLGQATAMDITVDSSDQPDKATTAKQPVIPGTGNSSNAGPRTKLQASAEDYLSSRTALSEPVLAGNLVNGHSNPASHPSPPNLKRRFQSATSPHFSLEVLLKHRELQVVEEEGAKGQVALEQLRRCFLIPHPSVGSTTQAMNWSGSAPEASASRSSTMDSWITPEGVVDGPYSRHYSQWLLQDPRFNGLPANDPLQMPLQAQANGPLRLQNIKNTTQCLYRRKDGVVVSLKCIDCKRENFSSPQGFINHCRIAHQRDFASHEAAAEACGTEVDEIEAANVYMPGRPVRTTVSSGPYQNTRHQVAATAPMTIGTASPLAIPTAAEDQLTAYPTRQIPTTKSGSHRKKSNDSSQSTTAEGGLGAKRSPTSTVHLRKFLKRKNMDIEDLDGMIERTVSSPGISDTEEELDIDEEEDERSELEDTAARGRRRPPPSAARMTTAATSPQKKQKKTSPSNRRSTATRLPTNHRVVKLKITGIGGLPRFDDDPEGEPVMLSRAGKDPSVIPRVPPRPEGSDSSSDEDYVDANSSSLEKEIETFYEPSSSPREENIPNNAIKGNRKRSNYDTGGTAKKNRP